MSEWVRRFWIEEQGQDLVEYSLLVTFLAIACMWVISASRGPIGTIWTNASARIGVASTAATGGN